MHQLCNNFCKRYITALKSKMPLDLIPEDDQRKDKAPTKESEEPRAEDFHEELRSLQEVCWKCFLSGRTEKDIPYFRKKYNQLVNFDSFRRCKEFPSTAPQKNENPYRLI